MVLADKLNGTWSLVHSEHFDEYLKEVGVGLITRKMATTLKPTLTFTIDGENWKMVSESTFKTLVWEFQLDKEVDQVTGDGRQVKSTYTLDGDKLIQVEKATKGDQKDSRFERYIDEKDQLIVNCECNGVVSKRVYKKT